MMLADYALKLREIERKRQEINNNRDVYTVSDRARLRALHQQADSVMHDMAEHVVDERDLAVTYQRLAMSQIDPGDEDNIVIIGVLSRVLEYLLTLQNDARTKPWTTLAAMLALHILLSRHLSFHVFWNA